MSTKSVMQTLLFLLAAAGARAEPVVTFTWNVEQGRQGSTEVVYAGASGMLTEQRRADGTVTGEFVVLPDRLIMNDVASERSMVLDPANMPQIPGFGGAAGGGAIADALAQAQGALRNAPPEARRALEGILGGGAPGAAGGAAPARTPAQFTPTGNTGTTDGMDWVEYQASFAGQTSTVRLVDWSEIEGAEIVANHYRNMAEIFATFMANTGMGAFLQGLDMMPREIVDFMIEGRRFPIYMAQGRRVQQLTGVGRDDIDAGRFGPRFPVQSFGR